MVITLVPVDWKHNLNNACDYLFKGYLSLYSASKESLWRQTFPRCAQLTQEQNVQKANKLLHCIQPPELLLSTLWHFAKKKSIFFFCCSYTPPPFLPPSGALCERQRNFIEKMEGTGKTRVPGGVLQGFRLHQRLPFSAGRWTHNGKMSVAAVTRISHWLGFGRGWGEGVVVGVEGNGGVRGGVASSGTLTTSSTKNQLLCLSEL